VVELPADFIGRGFGFPPNVRPGASLPWVGGDEKIRQSIWLILATAPGERPMRPTFGCGIHDLVFAANTAGLHGLVTERVRDALVRWEPRIDVVDVRADPPDDERGQLRNRLLIRIDYRIRGNNSIFNLVYPLFINEGAGA
jgi:phage baseplate assembly protein W